MADALKVDANIVRGCQSQVWIDYRLDDGRLYFTLDSDAMIVRGLIAIVLAAFNGRTPDAILAYDIDAAVQRTRPDAPSEPDPRQWTGRTRAPHPRHRHRGSRPAPRLKVPFGSAWT